MANSLHVTQLALIAQAERSWIYFVQQQGSHCHILSHQVVEVFTNLIKSFLAGKNTAYL